MDIIAKGIDVSKHQGKIDWARVKAAGVQFAMIRVGWTWYEGGLDIDAYFNTNIENAISVGLPVGVYVYSYDRSASAAKTAAKLVLDLVAPYKLSYPIAFDMEYEDFNITVGKRAINTDICIAFLDEIEKAGYYGTLYSSKDFFNNYLELDRLKKFDKWVAQYNSQCTFTGEYGMWQYSYRGKINGITGDVDLDYAYKDYPKLIAENDLNIPETPSDAVIIESLRAQLKEEIAKRQQLELQLEMVESNLLGTQQKLAQLQQTVTTTAELLLEMARK